MTFKETLHIAQGDALHRFEIAAELRDKITVLKKVRKS